MSDTLVWTAESETFVPVPDSGRQAAIEQILTRLRSGSDDETLREEGRRSLLRWADPLRA